MNARHREERSDEAISAACASEARLLRGVTLGLAEGETRGLALTKQQVNS
jgi:hypothetical protein